MATYPTNEPKLSKRIDDAPWRIWIMAPRFFLFVATEGKYVYIYICICTDHEEAAWNTVCLRDTCIYSTRFRQSRLAGKVLREMDGPIFYFAAPRARCRCYIRTLYTNVHASRIHRCAYIHRKVHGQEIPRVGAREPKITNEEWHGGEGRDLHERGVGFISRLLI